MALARVCFKGVGLPGDGHPSENIDTPALDWGYAPCGSVR